VFVDASTPGQRAAFENVEKEVRTAWLEEQKVLASEKAYRAIRARYTVLVPAMPDSLPSADTGALPPPPGSNP